MTDESRYLLAMARRFATPYTSLPGIRCIMVTGSVAKGIADHYSDLDIDGSER